MYLPDYLFQVKKEVLTGDEHRCTFTAARGQTIGWKAEYPPEHIFEAAGEEVDLVLQHS